MVVAERIRRAGCICRLYGHSTADPRSARPAHAPGKEPPGYLEGLEQRDPEVIWNDDAGVRPRLETEADWLKAGEAVFDAAIFYDGVATAAHVRSADWHAQVQPPMTEDGILPFTSYVIREKGKVELGNNACGFCHTRVLPNGLVVKGAQGNFPFDRALAYSMPTRSVDQARRGFRVLFGAPWLKTDPTLGVDALSMDDIVGKLSAIPAGGTPSRERRFAARDSRSDRRKGAAPSG
jgi:hypothetical protein